MELHEVIESAGACRRFRPEPVGSDLLARVLGAGRFGPSGGNRQPVRFLLVCDPDKKREVGRLYRAQWEPYRRKLEQGTQEVRVRAAAMADADHFGTHFDEVPAMVVVCARLADLLVTDRDLDRVSIVGGASVYPAVQNVLLACREAGLGACLTTLPCAAEPALRALLAIPDGVAVAAVLAIGHPARPLPKRLARRPLREMVFVDSYGAGWPAIGGR